MAEKEEVHKEEVHKEELTLIEKISAKNERIIELEKTVEDLGDEVSKLNAVIKSANDKLVDDEF